MTGPTFQQPAGRATPPEPSGEDQPRQPITLRALLLGLLLVPLLCFWNVYSEIVAQSTELAGLSLTIGAVFALLALLLLNAALRRRRPGWVLTRSELLFIYVMQAVSIGISSVGMLQFLVMGLANFLFFARPENGWADRYHPHLRSWAFPQASQLRPFYAGDSTLFVREHLLAWVAPVVAWSGFVVVLLATTLCVNVLIRRRWIEEERLTFPVAALPLSLTQNGRRAFLADPLLWLGILVPLVLDNLAAVAYLFPSVPFLPIKPSDPRLALSFDEAGAPWSAIGTLQFSFYPTVVGFVYLLPLDVSFSCWFFFLLGKGEDLLATAWGFRDPGASQALARFPYSGEQGLGAFLAIALLSLWGMRSALRRTAAERSAPFRDPGDPIPPRWAAAGAAAGVAALTGFAVAIGLAWYLALAFFLLYLMVILTYTRIRAEAGLPWAFGPNMTPHQLIAAGAGTAGLALPNLVGLSQFQWMDLDYRVTAMPHQLEAMKIAGDARLNVRHVFFAILLATAVGTLASWAAILSCYYRFGAGSAHVDSWRTEAGNQPWNLLDGWVNNPSKPDLPRLAAAGVGMVVTMLLVAARLRFSSWPLNAIGYVLSGTFTMPWLWCATFLGWGIKALIVRYGLVTYRRLYPLFIGLILGEYVTGSLWAIIGCLTGIQTYRVLPI